MKISRTLTLLFLMLLPALNAQDAELIDWDYEIDLLGRELAQKHPTLFFQTDSTWFFHEMRQLAAQTAGKTTFQISIRLQQVLALMGDAQTQINYHFMIEKSRILPFESYWFEDGIYMLETDRMYEALLGKKLIAVNGVSIEVVIDSLATLLVNENPSVAKNSIPRMLTWFQLHEYFGFATGEEISLTVGKPSGEENEVLIKLPVELGEMVRVQAESIPLGWQDRNTFFRDQYFEDENLLYIQYNRCWSREVEEDIGSGASALFMPSFKEFEKQVLPVIRKMKIDKLVFDMRFNRGGYAPQGTEFIRKICKSLPREHGDIFVLVGRTTCASAIINTVDFMNSAEVILVGEATGGKPNYFGEVRRFVLPESRLIVSHSTKSFHLMDEDLPTITPDLMVPIDYERYMKGIDPAIEAVRHHIDP